MSKRDVGPCFHTYRPAEISAELENAAMKFNDQSMWVNTCGYQGFAQHDRLARGLNLFAHVTASGVICCHAQP
jgi:hypothetical protein